MTQSPKKNVSSIKSDESTLKEGDPYAEERAQENWQWQHALSQSLAAVADCIRAIPPDELESKFHLLLAYAKANAHAIARGYNRSCLRLTDLLCPLLDKNESAPLDFPDTLGHFQQLSQEAVLNLLVTYQIPEIPDSDDERRIDLARYLGVSI
ncbi:hypothetical protein R1sor_012562 [Riccia sorocarpa]|uniref:Uncharacterized protein n=1 Tax=Riccia sorocarpa TaxID=122646 RepID=A0ABD3I881_9MARC